MRGMGGSFAGWWRRHLEWCSGRIFEHPTNWVLIDRHTPPALLAANGIPFRDRTDADGRPMRLIRQVGVHCSNPLVGGEGPHPRLRTDAAEEPLYFVPASVCRHCPWRWPRGAHALGYPHCGWALKVRGGRERAARDMRAAGAHAWREVRDRNGGGD